MSDYIFPIAVAATDPEGYYYTRWDRAAQLEILAPNKAEAFEQAWAVMGEAPRGRYWTAKLTGTVRPACKCQGDPS